MSGELGKASLDLEANLGPFERKIVQGEAVSDRLRDTLEKLAAVGDIAQNTLNDIGIGAGQGARSRVTAEEIISGVRGISDESRMAAHEIDRVKLGTEQAAETVAAGDIIDHKLDDIRDNASRTRRALDGVRLRLLAERNAAGSSNRPGYGVGPFGAGYGRLGVVGTAVGLGALTAPAAAPAAIGLLASIPMLAAAGAGALGTLALAFGGVFKAIGGDKKAFDDLTSSQKQFVLTVRSLDGWLDRLKQIAAQSLFPGLTKGLKAALSPGTINTIETALVQLGHALGSAGAMWGRYFGSEKFQQIFGPLMQAAARNIGVMSDTLLHLFDALGVIARAAIPFTNWLTTAADKGARFVDTWLRARDATGQLGGAMREAESSLRLVGGLAAALLRVIWALGVALYPLAKIAVKALTDGLDALAGIVNRNRGLIQAIAEGALKSLIATVKLAASGVGTLRDGLHAIGGQKAVVIAAVTAIGIAISVSLGPVSTAIIGALAAIGLIRTHWAAMVNFFANLGRAIVFPFKYAWHVIEVGAIKAALKVVEPFSHLPGVLGGWARRAKDSMQSELDKLHAPNMDWRKLAARDGTMTAKAWNDAFEYYMKKNQARIRRQALNQPPLPESFWLAQHPGATHKDYEAYVKQLKLIEQMSTHTGAKRHKHREPKPGTHAWYMEHLGYDPTQAPTYGPQPPFTTNTGGPGKPPVIPATAQHLIALASQEASKAANAKSVKAERKALEKEIADLEKADKILLEKWRHAHGKAKTALFNAITRVQNEIRSAQKKLRDAAANARVDRLNLALDQAKLAVENAQQGSKAWDNAVAAEEKALKAEIRYWDRRAHNDKLSADARDAALKKELYYQKQLKALLAPIKAAAAANIAEFLQTFTAIQNSFAPNAFPVQTGSGQTDTHLHDIKNEARQTNQHLKAIRHRGRHPGSQASQAAAMAVGA